MGADRMSRLLIGCCVAIWGLIGSSPSEAAGRSEWLRLSPEQLRCLFQGAELGPVPCGSFEGETAFVPTERCHRVRSCLANTLWQGKQFGPGTMINRWAAGAEAVPGRVSSGCSLLDGRPCHVIEYRGQAHIWKDIRDEIRQIEPGFYLGVMLDVSGPKPVVRAYFTLRATCR